MKKETDEKISVQEACALAKVKPGTIYNKCCRGELDRFGTRKKTLLSKKQVIQVFGVDKKAS